MFDWDRRALGQGHLRPEREGRHKPAAKGHDVGRGDLHRGDLHQNPARTRASRRSPEQGMAHAAASEAHGARSRPRGGINHAHGSATRDVPASAGPADVRKAQAALNQQGFDVGSPDGKLGKRTRQALVAFQKRQGLKASGKVDRATLDALVAGGTGPAAQPAATPQPNPGQEATSPPPPAADHGSGNPAPAAPAQAEPQGPGPQSEPATTGQGGAPSNPPQPLEGETSPAPETQMPDSGASGRVPAGSPHEDEETPTDDHR